MRRFRLILGWIGLGLAAALGGQSPAGVRLTLAQALSRARANSPQFLAALDAQGIAHDTQTIARSALLPSLLYNNSYIYTEGARYIANNGVHEYVSQGDVHEALGLAQTAGLKRAQAGMALARAEAEIAARGLAQTVTGSYYTLVAADHKIATAQQALADAQKYVSISQDLERGGEVAHADVIKSQIEAEQKQRDLTEAQLAREQAQLTLAVLLFPDFEENFTLADDLDQTPPLPERARVDSLAGAHNPALAAAQAALAQATQDVSLARANLLPSLTLDYFYGIDAAQFAARNEFGQPNLGSAAVATVNIPIFDWGGSRAKVHQSNLLAQEAKQQLSLTQRQLLADLQGFYAEAQAAHDELATLASSRDLAAESLRLTALQYQNGDASILELVDAQNTLTLARNAYDDGEVRYRVALANLQTLTGVF